MHTGLLLRWLSTGFLLTGCRDGDLRDCILGCFVGFRLNCRLVELVVAVMEPNAVDATVDLTATSQVGYLVHRQVEQMEYCDKVIRWVAHTLVVFSGCCVGCSTTVAGLNEEPACAKAMGLTLLPCRISNVKSYCWARKAAITLVNIGDFTL